jgi:hypothetical protein
MWYRLIKSSPIHDRSYRDWNQRTGIVERVLQRPLGHNNNLVVECFKQLNAFSPLPFNAAMDAQRIHGTHYVNLADALLRYFVVRRTHELSTNFAFTSPSGSSKPLSLATDTIVRQEQMEISSLICRPVSVGNIEGRNRLEATGEVEQFRPHAAGKRQSSHMSKVLFA